MSDFVHLHVHSEYSLLDGAIRLDQLVLSDKEQDKTEHVSPLVNALKEMGMTACAITDHGNLYGVHTFVTAMRKAGLKPIIGSEFYVADDLHVKTPETMHRRDHLILLAKNQTGYKNLMKLSTISFVDGFYVKPRIDLDTLARYSEGLICCSACLAGRIPQLLLKNDFDGAKEYALRLKGMFAEGDFYIELQDHGLEEQKRILKPLVSLAREIGVKVVATNDAHYLKRTDADTQDTMMCITLQCKKTDPVGVRFSNDEFYLKSGEEMERLFDWIPEAIASTKEIADKVDGDYFVVKYKKTFIPHYENDDMNGRDAKAYLHDLAWERIHRRFDVITPEIEERLNYELGVIDRCGFNDYFLIVWDFVNAAKSRGIPVGPGRGSGVGSLVAYAIGITDVDPLRYSLLFERFLSEERVSMPDFDIDFCFVRRPEVIEYVVEKYGAPNVAQIIAYSTMSAKAAVKDVARVYDVPYTDSNNWVKDIPVGKVLLRQCLTPGSSMYSEEFATLYRTNPTAKKVVDTAIQLEGMPRQTSMHAAGVVICGDPIVEHVPLSRNGNDITTQFDKNMVEAQGLLKMDFLGLKTLTDINEAVKYIKEDKGVEVDFGKLGYEDPNVYALIAGGDCEAVFQLEGGGMKKFMMQLQPTNLEDVMAGISMYRPGPMQFLDLFIQGKRDPSSVHYAHPLLKSVLENTYGCIVYQEQVMQIAQKIAGYSFGGADIMRRSIAKKKLDVLMQQKEIFINGGVLEDDITHKQIPGAVKNGVAKEIAEELFEQILKFASYAFNKSHAAAYSVVSYQTAWLKCYYPTHFITAVINNRITNADEVKHYINYLRRTGVKILAPDINRSKKVFSIENDNVRYGLMGIKNVGEQAMEYVLGERERGGAFSDLRDFLERCAGQVNKRMVESLIKGGAFDSFGKTRATLMASYERIMDAVATDRKNQVEGQLSLFDELIEDVTVKYTELPEYDLMHILAGEKEVLGMYVSGHPLDNYTDTLREFNFETSMLYTKEYDENGDEVAVLNRALTGRNVCMGCIVESHERKMTGKQQRFAVGRLEDREGSIEFSMYPRAYESYGSLLEADVPVKAYGRLDLRDESEPKISLERLEVWENGAKKRADVTRSGVIYVLVEDPAVTKIVTGLLAMFPGEIPVRAQMKNADGRMCLREFKQKVAPDEELLRRIANLVGEDKVRYDRSK